MSFGIHFGRLVALHRGEQGLTQRQLAIRAFDDESRKPRISELERGKTANPDQAIVDALTVALNLSPEQVSDCRTKGQERTGIITFEQHEEIARQRVAEAEEKLRTTNNDELVFLQRQLDEAKRRLEDKETDYARTLQELEAARDRLSHLHNTLEAEKITAAERALERGETTLADALFAEAQEKLTAQAGDMAAQAAALAFQRGRMAEEAIRLHDADQHYAEAARLSPTYEHLAKAGMLADKCGDYRRGSRIKEQLIEAAAAESGSESTQMATALNNLAENYRALGRFAEAEPLFRQALAIDAKTIGTDHPNYAIDLNNLALVLEATGRFDAAEPLYRQAMAITEKTIGTDHPDYAIHLNNLALLLEATGRTDAAEPLYAEAVKILRAALGEDHPSTKTVLANYERCKAAQGGS